jgi:SAM-dependent methyltransferase
MPQASDQTYLLNEQYKNSANLTARIQLHERFSVNKYDWYRWIFDHFKIAPGSRILELGCGHGKLWLHNLDRILDNWDVTLSDFSPGMLQEAEQNLRPVSHHPFTFAIIDAQSIPFGNESLMPSLPITCSIMYRTGRRHFQRFAASSNQTGTSMQRR